MWSRKVKQRKTQSIEQHDVKYQEIRKEQHDSYFQLLRSQYISSAMYIRNQKRPDNFVTEVVNSRIVTGTVLL